MPRRKLTALERLKSYKRKLVYMRDYARELYRWRKQNGLTTEGTPRLSTEERGRRISEGIRKRNV